MHIGKSYALPECTRWTRRKSPTLIVVATTQVAAYQLPGWHWLAMPWAQAAQPRRAHQEFPGSAPGRRHRHHRRMVVGLVAAAGRGEGIAHICHGIECDLRQMPGEAAPAATPQLNHHISL